MKEAKKYGQQFPGKILFVNLEGHLAGAENSLLLTVKHLPSIYTPLVACPGQGELALRLGRMGVPVYSLPQTPKKKNHVIAWLCYFFRANLKLVWILIRHRPKLVHANTTKAALAVFLGVVLLRIKLVWHVRDVSSRKWLLRICSAYSSKVIAVSNSIRNQLVANGVSSEKIKVIGNSVDISRNCSRASRIRSSKLVTFANIGQFVPWKKQALFIEAAEMYLDKGYHARFIIIGADVFGRDAQYENKLRKQITHSPHSDAFEIIPWQQDLTEIWNQIDCLVHTASKEPFGRVIIEAMEQQVPVIASDAFGPSEIIQDQITGFLFQPNDLKELVHCMEMVSNNPALVSNVISACWKYIRLNHDIRKTIKLIEAVYSTLLTA